MVEEQNTPEIYEEDVYSEEEEAVDTNLLEEDLEEEQQTTSLVDEEEEFDNEQARLYDQAQAVLRGEHGRGQERRDSLGEDYYKVMTIVREIRTSKWN